jgi:predicted nicotinamide N-methyase
VGKHRLSIRRPADLETLWQQLDDESFGQDERIPYWVEVWPSSLALAEHLVASRHRLQGRWCLDLGCGLGLTACLAARLGARVVGMDYEPQALAYARKNALANQARVAGWTLMDWRAPGFAPRAFDRIWGAEVVYEARFFDPLLALFQEALAPDGAIWLAAPPREVTSPLWDRLDREGWAVRRLERRQVSFREYRRMEVHLLEITRR